jgi:hypothetical protein
LRQLAALLHGRHRVSQVQQFAPKISSDATGLLNKVNELR